MKENMHSQTLNRLQHEHNFAVVNKKGERRTKVVLVLTFLTMELEIAAGTIFGSMALLADGWHMGTHVAAFMITLFAYRYSRKHAHDETFAFSSGKVGILGGFASSVALAVVALMMLIESGQRLLTPRLIQFDEALLVAAFGLFVNFISALLLRDSHDQPGHAHQHPPKKVRKGRYHQELSQTKTHEHKHDLHHDHDHNLKAAYFHVLADALTSVLAIAALYFGKSYGWHWLDPVMGGVGGLIIVKWAYALMRETSPILLDESIALRHKTMIKNIIEADADNRVADLHVWRVGPSHYAAIISVVSHHPKSPDYYKALLTRDKVNKFKLAHMTVEVYECKTQDCEESGSK